MFSALQNLQILSLFFIMVFAGCIPTMNLTDNQSNYSNSADVTVSLPTSDKLFRLSNSANLADYIDGAQIWIEVTDNSCAIDPNSLKQSAKPYAANLLFPVSLKAGCSYKITLYLGKLDLIDQSKIATTYSLNSQPGLISKEQIAQHLSVASGTAMSLVVMLSLTPEAISAGIQFANGEPTALTPAPPVGPILSAPPVAPITPPPSVPAIPIPSVVPPSSAAQEIDLKVINGGYDPSSFNVTAGRPVRLKVTRTEKGGCGEEIVFPAFNKSAKLELNIPVIIEFTPKKAGEFKFTCGMNMYEGKVVVQ